MAKQQDAAPKGDTKTQREDVDDTVFGPLSENDLSAMTEAERNAMAPDEEDEEAETAEAEDAEAGEDADADEEAEHADAEQGNEADEEAEDDDEQGEDAEADKGDGEEAAPEFEDDEPAIPDYKMPEKAQDQLTAIEKKGVEIAEKFDSGDLTAGEFHRQMAENSDAKGKLLTAIDRATWAQDQRVAHFTKSTVPQFLKSHPEYRKNPVLYRALDGEVRALQTEAGQKGENFLSARILAKAHANVAAAFGRENGAVQNGKKAGNKKPTVEQRRKAGLPDKGNRADTPPTLARVPSDTNDEIHDSKFGRLDRMRSTDFEESFAKMTPAERDEYLRTA